VTAALNFTKARSMRWVSLVSAVISAVYMLVIALSTPNKFVDTRPLTNVTGIEYTPFVLITAIALFVFAVISAAFILVDNYVFVKESKNDKALVIPKRVVRFFREYKSEVRKIVWPGPKSIVKNTLIVLILCAILGVFIWLLDWGLGSLINIILDV
ncbi:MAG: preprotein translocase subunit SecE, partial [bacterium]|nr:preprotein translocase subunit SecE [bacterium]